MPKPQFLDTPYGARLAYQYTPGRSPGVMFLTGFKSDMEGGKAIALEEHCQARGQAFLRFDYRGHGQSSHSFEEGCIGDWAEDAVAVLDAVADGPQILVGSSMGGWIMLLTALARPDRVAGLVGIAAAPDFTEDLIWQPFDDDQKAAMNRDGFVEIPNCYDEEPYRITARLIEDGRDHLLLRDPISLDVPVRLIQGMEDEDVPWNTALRLQEQLASADVDVTLVKDGGHRLSEPQDLDRLARIVDQLLDGPGRPGPMEDGGA
ncbi:MAG: alpha/beta hydrolase [Rhodospirillales bacterium]